MEPKTNATNEADLFLPDLRRGADDFRETHISWLIFRGPLVYKIKKPVCFGFLDFRSKQTRKEACEAEVALNRRLSPSVYLRVVAIVRGADGRYCMHDDGGEGESVDYAVEMRRLSDEDAADRRLDRGALTHEHVERLGQMLAAFHASARSDDVTAAFGTPEVVRGNVVENFEQTRKSAPAYLPASDLAEIEHFQLGFLSQHESLFSARAARGRVRDGHGDLRLEHVYVGRDSLDVIDCIEFNERFRFADVCADVAFLAMDLGWHERDDLAQTFLASYARHSQDYELFRLVDFYQSYRAYVRGKVGALTLETATLPDDARTQLAEDVRKHYLLALAYARPPLRRPILCAVGGVVASGKSTLARALRRELRAIDVDADRARKHLFGVAPTQSLGDAVFSGAYDAEASRRVYDEIGTRAHDVLASGRSVVVDASFRSRQSRAALRALAKEQDVELYFVECRAPREILERRLAARRAEPSGHVELVSDARLPLLDAFLESYEPVDELPAREHVIVDTSGPIDAAIARALGKLRAS